MKSLPGERCSATTEFSFWRWVREEGDQADDLPALLIDGQLVEDGDLSQEMDTLAESRVLIPSTVNLGHTQYRACDVALFYTHLPPDFVIEPNDTWLGLPEPSDDYPRLPVSFIEVKRNVSRQLKGHLRLKKLTDRLGEAQDQLGEQAGFMFGNCIYDQLPYIIGIAMAAEAWRYAVFRRNAKPTDFGSTGQWVLAESEWSEILYWGTPNSNGAFAAVRQQVTELLGRMGFVVV